jgi:uncharacterized protein
MQGSLVDVAAETLRSRAGALVAAYMFGSTARGTAGPHSDVDIAILLKEGAQPGLRELHSALTFELELCLKRPVDLVVLNDAPSDLVHRVLRDGVLLLECDSRARAAFEVRTRAHFFDLAPLRRLYRHGAAGAPAERAKR